jgi:hypothetical protein
VIIAGALHTIIMEKAKPIVLLLLAWFCLALAGGVAGWFENFSAAGIAITVWALTAVALLLCWKNCNIRAWALTVDLKWLIALHVTRFVGFYFLVLVSRGELPSGFAQPAGIGDISVAVLALLLIAVRSLGKMRLLVGTWNAFGLIDILFVVASALRFGLHDLASMLPLRILPLSLLPTFFVPLIIISHILIFVRLTKKPVPSD